MSNLRFLTSFPLRMLERAMPTSFPLRMLERAMPHGIRAWDRQPSPLVALSCLLFWLNALHGWVYGDYLTCVLFLLQGAAAFVSDYISLLAVAAHNEKVRQSLDCGVQGGENNENDSDDSTTKRRDSTTKRSSPKESSAGGTVFLRGRATSSRKKKRKDDAPPTCRRDEHEVEEVAENPQQSLKSVSPSSQSSPPRQSSPRRRRSCEYEPDSLAPGLLYHAHVHKPRINALDRALAFFVLVWMEQIGLCGCGLWVPLTTIPLLAYFLAFSRSAQTQEEWVLVLSSRRSSSAKFSPFF